MNMHGTCNKKIYKHYSLSQVVRWAADCIPMTQTRQCQRLVCCQNLTVEAWIISQAIPRGICGKASHLCTIHLLLHPGSSQHHQINRVITQIMNKH